MAPFQLGDRIRHPYNPDLGVGEVTAVDSRRMTVRFSQTGQLLQFSVEDHVFVADTKDGCAAHDLVERLAGLDADPFADWVNRMDALQLAWVREADGLGSFLGGRIRLFPHQLHVAEQATALDPVRWLLADEVGLGKTVEACLILNRLLRTGRADRVLVVAPSSLTVQWLGELYRKFHQTFVLLDGRRLKDVRTDFGDEFNPFDAHPRAVVALEDLIDRPDLVRHALAVPPDLLVVDEAHHLERAPGHPGSAAYRAVAPLCEATRHTLLLTATPLEADVHGFYRLLELLAPEEVGAFAEFEAKLAAGISVVTRASSTRRADIGGLPPRVPRPVPVPGGVDTEQELATLLAPLPTNPLQRRRRAHAVERALGTPRGRTDPRLAWLAEQETRWHRAGEKALVFVHDRAALTILKDDLERATRRRVAVFHEDMTPAARDLEVGRFAAADGPTLLVSTEAGGEGRNFEFCRGLVLFDLPWDPVLVEQRIGRLDRISRTDPVEIHYFVPEAGLGRRVAHLYAALGVFGAPLGGLDRSLGPVREAVVESLDQPDRVFDPQAVAGGVQAARGQVNRALYAELHRHRYRAELAEGLLARVPEGLDQLNARVVLGACRRYGFDLDVKADESTWYLEFGSEATVDQVPGVAEGSRWLGTFDREQAVIHEPLDYFAAGHPLVEGVLLELEDGLRGRVGLVDVPGTGVEGFGIAAWVVEAPEPRVFDLTGAPRPDWVVWFTAHAPGWRLADLDGWGFVARPAAVAAWGIRVRKVLGTPGDEAQWVAVAGFRLLP